MAQIGLMHRELVQRDRWIDEDRFRKTLAVYQAIPGPEAHELAVYFGMIQRGRWGGFLTGLAFMLPGVLLVTALAALYVRLESNATWADPFLYGVRPAVVALVGVAFLRLLRRSATTPTLALIALASALMGWLAPQVNFLLLLLGGGALAFAVDQANRSRLPPAAAWAFPFTLASFPALAPDGLAALSVLMAKVGLLTFGGAYTAIPFLHQGAVQDHAWMTNDQFLDALALTGMVPGPLVAVGTFVGFVAAGPVGAALATLIIFAPAFAFTLLGHNLLERAVHAPRLHAFLLGVTAAVIGLIGASLLPLARAALIDPLTVAVALLAAGARSLRRVPIPVVIMAAAGLGALAGLAL